MSLLKPIAGTPYISTTKPGHLAVGTDGLQVVIKNNLGSGSDPTVNSDSSAGYAIGSLWTTSSKVFVCVSASVGVANWVDTSALLAVPGSGNELLYRVNASTLGAIPGSDWNGTTLVLPGMRTGRLIVSANDIELSIGTLFHIATDMNAVAKFEQASVDTDCFDLNLQKSRGDVMGPLIVASGDALGSVNFLGYDGASHIHGAQIIVVSEGTIDSGRVPAKLLFGTATDTGLSSLTYWMSLNSAGLLVVPAITSVVNGVTLAVGGSATEYLNKQGNYVAISPGVTDHGLLTGLADDDHTQYALLLGRATPQQLAFGTAASATAGYLTSTSHATKGSYSLNAAGTIVVNELNLSVRIGAVTSLATSTPSCLNMGGSYADSVTSTKVKWKLYDDGVAANIYGIGISLGQMNFFISTGIYAWHFADTQKAQLTETGKFGLNKSGTLGAQLHVLQSGTTVVGQINEGITNQSVPLLRLNMGSTPTGNVFEVNSTPTGTTGDLVKINSTGGLYIAGSIAGDSATKNFLNVTATLPSSLSAITSGVLISVTTAGSSNQEIDGLAVNLNAGYTGGNYPIAITAENAVAGIGTSGLTLSTSNIGINGAAIATTVGHNVGQLGVALGGNVNIALGGRANFNKNSATNIGVYGLALNTGSSPIQIGGLFFLGTTAPGALSSAALMADNGATLSDIFVARDNGTAKITITNGGDLVFADSVSIISGTATGSIIFTTTNQKGSFWGAAPIIQPAHANQAAITDSTTGTPAAACVDVGVVFSQSVINANFATVLTLLNQVRNQLTNLGLWKGAA